MLDTELDETYWLATSAPLDAFACDPVFLRYLDGDGDGRIRSADIKDAIRWLGRVLTSIAGLDERAEHLELDRLSATTPEGERLRACRRGESLQLNAGQETGDELFIQAELNPVKRRLSHSQ